MIRSLYDTSVITWSPQGKLFQVEYAMEAVKQGSICLGLRSKKAAVLCSLKRSQSELASYQEKIFKIDDYIGMAMAGLTADARVLCKYMRNECLNHKYVFESPHPMKRLINKVAEKSQIKTQRSSKRPYGVGLLVVGIDQDGPHLYETCPSGNLYEYYAYAIGARSQAARTYFEDNFKAFNNCDTEQLILHGLSALKKISQEENEVVPKSVEIAFVAEGVPFTVLKLEEIEEYFKKHETFKPQDQMEIVS
eukprot:CAMPEP_0176422294 /NCGR_PEP_ID=MMETSP0127-20121128/9654_1 /TAXON_ID=938130 /ORGANISM="Platyophrya macrostoma, Strain WH" /LENGTH=249 /DNA_ID=CAMNT_0017803129 /DNA_START=32 /DNA_END=781 /DNA_ORIENTATION=+